MPDQAPNIDRRAIETAVSGRYAKLADACCGLSCGNALDLAAPRPGEVLVDLGCGRGQDVIRAAERVGASGEVVGVDANEAMLQKARSSLPTFLTNARFVRSDLAALDLPDAMADVVISNCTINHAPDKEAAYREIRRILKGGGRFVVSDVIAEQELPAPVREDPAAWAACYGGAIPEADYVGAIQRAGFGSVEVLQRTEPYEKGGVTLRSLTLRGMR